MNYDFTAQMEDSLDEVASHKAEWKKVLDSFFSDFTNQLEKAEKDPEEGGMLPNQMVLTSIDCPTCGRKMGIRTATTGVFLGCFLVMRCHRRALQNHHQPRAGERSSQRAGRGRCGD